MRISISAAHVVGWVLIGSLLLAGTAAGQPALAIVGVDGTAVVVLLGSLERRSIVTARDGYQVAYAISELDAAFSDQVILLADRRDGKPLLPWQIIHQLRHDLVTAGLAPGIANPPDPGSRIPDPGSRLESPAGGRSICVASSLP